MARQEIRGIGPNVTIETNELGGKQSKSPYRFDLIDAPAIFDLAERLAYGAERYEDNNWRKIPERDHLNHALVHIFAHLGGDEQDKHLEAAFCRLMMALAIIHQGGPKTLKRRILEEMYIPEKEE